MPEFKKVQALIIGRFQKEAHVNEDLLRTILLQKNTLKNIPIIANIDFGHTDPKITLPIGRKVSINSNMTGSNISLSPLQ